MGTNVIRFNEDRRDTVRYDPEVGAYRIRYEPGQEPPSLAIVAAVASIEGVDPTALGPLAETIDMDALDAVVRPPKDGSEIEVAFPIRGYRATVHSDGEIELRPTDTASRDTVE